MGSDISRRRDSRGSGFVVPGGGGNGSGGNAVGGGGDRGGHPRRVGEDKFSGVAGVSGFHAESVRKRTSASGANSGAEGFRLEMERVITARMQEQLHLHRYVLDGIHVYHVGEAFTQSYTTGAAQLRSLSWR